MVGENLRGLKGSVFKGSLSACLKPWYLPRPPSLGSSFYSSFCFSCASVDFLKVTCLCRCLLSFQL